jgi:subtilase family serine protease
MVEGVRWIVGRANWENNSRTLNTKALHIKRCIDELQYFIPSVDCTRELSASYNGNQRGPALAHTATVTLVVTDPSDFSISVKPEIRAHNTP